MAIGSERLLVMKTPIPTLFRDYLSQCQEETHQCWGQLDTDTFLQVFNFLFIYIYIYKYINLHSFYFINFLGAMPIHVYQTLEVII